MATTLVVSLASAMPADPAGGAVTPDVLSSGDIAELRQLLDNRSSAVLGSDPVAHRASVDVAATQDFVDVEARKVGAMAHIGFENYAEALVEPVVDLTPPGGEIFDGAPSVTLEVRRAYRIAGFDDSDNVSFLYLTFVQRDDGWRVLGDDSLASIGLAGDRELWELFDTTVLRTERVLIVGTASESRHRQLATLTEQALNRFDDVWLQPWPGKVVMIVPANRDHIEALLQPVIDVSKFVAFTTLSVDRSEGWQVVAPRIVAQEANLALRAQSRQVEILVHELAHYASVTASGPSTPLWAHEGLAEWVTSGRRTTTGGSLVLPDLHRFRTGSTADIREVYNQANETMSRLAGTYGDGAPWALFSGIGAKKAVPGTADHVLDSVLRELTGSGLEELTR